MSRVVFRATRKTRRLAGRLALREGRRCSPAGRAAGVGEGSHAKPRRTRCPRICPRAEFNYDPDTLSPLSLSTRRWRLCWTATAVGLPLDVMKARLAETVEVGNDDLRGLAAERSERMRSYFLTVGKIAPERLLATVPTGAAQQTRGPRVFLHKIETRGVFSRTTSKFAGSR